MSIVYQYENLNKKKIKRPTVWWSPWCKFNLQNFKEDLFRKKIAAFKMKMKEDNHLRKKFQ